MTRNYIFTELKTIFAQIKPSLDINTISEDTRLVEDLGLDSLTILLLSFAIEKQFKFKFQGIQRFVYVRGVIDYIENNVEK